MSRSLRTPAPFVLLALAGACSSAGGEAVGVDNSADTGGAGYCRTTTCPVPAGYPTSEGECEPPGWSESDTCRSLPASNAPLWWRSACIGYDLNSAASRGTRYATFSEVVASAFSVWVGATCPGSAGMSRVSMDVRDLGPVTCATAGYNKDGPNQNLIVFHDDAWPYEAADDAKEHTPKSLTIALTTVTFDPSTGELLDADIELNSADYSFTTSSPEAPVLGGESFDLPSVLTHESGHFFGLAHSPLTRAVMNASGDTEEGTGTKRQLTLEDVQGICAIYPADGARSVSTLVASSGKVMQGSCDPTPRNGLTTSCD